MRWLRAQLAVSRRHWFLDRKAGFHQSWSGGKATVMAAKSNIHQGRCLCGAVCYETLADPVRVTTCYCRFCQRATGSPVFIEPIFEEKDFRIVSGKTTVFQHRSEGSGKLIFVNFCATCGTKIYLGFERFPGVLGLYAGTFDDPGWFAIRADNSKHIFLDMALDGTIIPPGFTTYREHAQRNDGTPCTATVYDDFHMIGDGRSRVA
jgi:hypothetical protein